MLGLCVWVQDAELLPAPISLTVDVSDCVTVRVEDWVGHCEAVLSCDVDCDGVVRGLVDEDGDGEAPWLCVPDTLDVVVSVAV